MMSERRSARKDALEILFESEITDRGFDEIIKNRKVARDSIPSEFTLKIINGIKDHQDRIDGIIRAHTDNWTLERMPVIDRNLIRIGLFEMLYEDDIPHSVSINEAVELAKIYGMEESSKFVNGVLGRVASELQEEERHENKDDQGSDSKDDANREKPGDTPK